jgi:cyclic-di-GMP phosphodiesterase TipF (flagellum assembly factor)
MKSEKNAMPNKRSRSGRLASLVVKTGIVLFAVATFLSLRLQIGLALPVALASSLTVLSLLMILDTLIRRDAPAEARGPDVDRLETEIAKLMGAAKARQDVEGNPAGALPGVPRPANDVRRAGGAPAVAGSGAPGAIPTARVPLPRPGGDPRTGGRQAPSLSFPPPPPVPPQRAGSPAAPTQTAQAAPAPSAPQNAGGPGSAPRAKPDSSPAKTGDNGWPETVMPSLGSPSDFWSYRPNAVPKLTENSGAPTLSVREPVAGPRAAAAPPPANGPAPGSMPASAPAPAQRRAAPSLAPAAAAQPMPPRPQPDHFRTDAPRVSQKPAPAVAPAAAAPTGGPRQSELEVVQGLIKKLADEVNAAEATAAGKLGKAVPRADGAINRSVDALRTTSETMRKKVQPATAGGGFGFRKKATMPAPAPAPAAPPVTATKPLTGLAPASGPRTPAGPQPPPLVGSAETRLAAIASAIAAGRIDVFLEPIRGLGDQVTRHYEVSVRLRGETGQPLEKQSSADLGGTGLLPSLDTARLFRVAEVARRLEQKMRPGSVFSAFNRESLTSDEFLNGFADVYRDRTSFSSQLVLTFSQHDVRGFSQLDWNTVADMRDFGFRFALSEVTDLDMDFEELTKKGFAFVKLDADVFLNGLPTASSSLVPAHDLCQYLAGIGLTLIVGRIDDEAKLARIFGFGVVFGQGQLFGGARPVKADVVTRQRTAAA